jgi:hypothetical protein
MEPVSIFAIISGIVAGTTVLIGAIHFKFKFRCGCCESDCSENEQQREIKRVSRQNSKTEA